jgi:YVTN family beta-propeller protein
MFRGTASASRLLVLTGLALILVAASPCSPTPVHEDVGHPLFTSPQADPIAISPLDGWLLVANTMADTLDVIDPVNGTVRKQVRVGVDPVSVAVRPGTGEAWVANHISDSVSVVDIDPTSPTAWTVIDTIQDVDPTTLVTNFDEPVGIAFADANKAYVALSSRDQIAVVDANTRLVTGTIPIASQDPRAMLVSNGRLFVASFESGNQTELSSCPKQAFPIDGVNCTFDQADFNFASNPNLVFAPVDIVRDTRNPDRDVYVFDTTTDQPIENLSSIGTLLYDLAADAQGNVYLSFTEALNDANGRAGTAGQGLVDLNNRMFLNQLAVLNCAGGPCTSVDLHDLEGAAPLAGDQLATPYGIAVSDDGALLVGTAASSSRLFVWDISAEAVVGRVDVGAMPRGIALASDPVTGAASMAYVLNTVGSSVSIVDVSDPTNPVELSQVALQDPTPADVRLGRIAFNDANASTTGTFSCGSCHPDGHTDQLLWIIGATCNFAGCTQEEPRSTMPIRGLRDTLPLHWDGVLGDPFGGTNGEVVTNPFNLISGPGIPPGQVPPLTTDTVPPNCTTDESCFRQLVDAAVAGVMCDQTGCPTHINENGLAGALSEAERDNMGAFLENVSYPPPRSRQPDDQLTALALGGFEDFFFNQGGVNPPGPNNGQGPETCADNSGGCHALPLGAGTNSAFVGGFEAPTMRGITDRYVLFSAGVTSIWEVMTLAPFVSGLPWTTATNGYEEFVNWSAAFGQPLNPGAFINAYNTEALPIFTMVEEASTGHSGAFGRQVALNTRTTAPATLAATEASLGVLEAADAASVVNLQLSAGLGSAGSAILLSYKGGSYTTGTVTLSRTEVIQKAQAGELIGVATASLGAHGAAPQPVLWVDSVGAVLDDGRLDLPDLPTDHPMVVGARHVVANATLFVDGAPVGGSVACTGGFVADACPSEEITITLDVIPAAGTHLLQVATPGGLMSNEFPFTAQ